MVLTWISKLGAQNWQLQNFLGPILKERNVILKFKKKIQIYTWNRDFKKFITIFFRYAQGLFLSSLAYCQNNLKLISILYVPGFTTRSSG